MATLRTATGSVLGVVTDTAGAVSSAANTISGSMGILNDMVTTARRKRKETTIVEMITFRNNLIQDSALDQVKREETIRTYIGNDEEKQKSFNAFEQKLNAAFEKHDKDIKENSAD
ncbi:MAG: hypothetical protein Unbinned4120contig1000_28 [Prokaryotic dsDNA virus sp.]|jgi:hypothetical protein|nr:MAG: hypothetical protein Unbinned4120contig1000_28 [Prokaryotic dsDNA virus sp.]|tara:strand:+ start:173 stop:520 length:348 start_codon:yes stop_codon:yes gene_type:complete